MPSRSIVGNTGTRLREEDGLSRHRPTLDDVARHCGLARATVSRAVTNDPRVSPATRERVAASVAALGYRANIQARMLASRRRRTILLIFASDIEDEPNSYYRAALEIGALRVCSALGLELTTQIVPQEAADAGRRILSVVSATACAGVVLTPPFSDDAALKQALVAQGERLALISPAEADPAMPSIGMDDEAAGAALADFLLRLGHRRFGFISGKVEHRSAERRYTGALAAIARAGLPAEAMTAVRGNFTFRSGTEQFGPLMRRQPPPTAIICANDDMAVGALFAAHRAGIAVPREVSIVGFDDTPVSALVWPPLTTVRQPLQQMAARAVTLLSEGAHAGEAGDGATAYQPFSIVERESCAPPA